MFNLVSLTAITMLIVAIMIRPDMVIVVRLRIRGAPSQRSPHNTNSETALYGWLSKLWSLFGVLVIIRHLMFRVPKKGP